MDFFVLVEVTILLIANQTVSHIDCNGVEWRNLILSLNILIIKYAIN